MDHICDDHYETLGVPRSADAPQIDRAFREHAKRDHPDGGGDSERFVRLRRAYAVLSDPTLRRRYDDSCDVGPPLRRDPWGGDAPWGRPSGMPPPLLVGRSSVPAAGTGARASPLPPGYLAATSRSTAPSPPPPPPPRFPTGPSVPAGLTTTNPWSVAAAVLMFLPFLAPLTVIAALVALKQIADSGGAQRGRKRSIIALAISALPALAMLL